MNIPPTHQPWKITANVRWPCCIEYQDWFVYCLQCHCLRKRLYNVMYVVGNRKGKKKSGVVNGLCYCEAAEGLINT